MESIMDTYNDYKGGRRYFGESKEGKEHGLGFYELDLWKQKFVGEFVDGKAHGLGIKIQGPGTNWARTYVGEYDQNEHSGIGMYKWENGAKYAGEYRNGVAKGMGVFLTWDGLKYVGKMGSDGDDVRVEGFGSKGCDHWITGEGQWFNSENELIDIVKEGYDIHGYRRVGNKDYWPEGWYYEGEFDENGFYSGFGKMHYSKTRYYEGDFKNNSQHGEGLDYYDEKNWIKGEFKKGEVWGHAEASFEHGHYVGGFRHNKFHGYGKLVYKGSVYEGNFKNITLTSPIDIKNHNSGRGTEFMEVSDKDDFKSFMVQNEEWLDD
jgi:hypothetical protein